ncbi:hypothetical protein DXG01_005211 [Tephrocybe rancida]|nr:hypothetical protein DXG01_005211 [Tephrocybe rancida]
MYKWGPKWMLALVIGEYCFALGFALRFAVHSNPNSISLYAIQNLFVILSPCAFIAADYVLLGRLTVYLGAEKYLVISPLKITRYFVVSDVLTFLVQAAGGGLSASASGSTLGARIFLAGLILQLVSFAVFIVIYGIFLQRVHKDSRLWGRDGSEAWYNDWRALAGALCVSCCGILIRSFYRVIELSQGYQGYFATTEGYFYGLDTLPLLIAIVIYTPFWPGRFIAASYHYDGNIHLDRVGS